MCEKQGNARISGPSILIFLMGAFLLLMPVLAQAQAIIKVNDNVNIRFGGLLQSWGDSQQDAATKGYGNNLFIRRMRFLVSGQVTPNLTFFFESDNPNLGKAPKAMGTGFMTQDA